MGLPLKIGILSISVSPLEEKVSVACLMLRKSAQALGHKVRIYHDAHFQFVLDHGITKYFYKGKPFITPDVMIIRASVIDNIDIRISTVKYLQLMKIPVVNYYLPIVRAKNKVRTMQILNHHGIPIPKTVVLHNINDLDSAAQQIGFPLILKVAFGTLGIGVSIIETIRSLRSTVDIISANFHGSLIIMQEYVKEAKGKDIRVFVVGNQIVAAMERKARRGEFRANFSLGGSVALADLTEKEKEISIEAVKAIGLHVAGVDIIRTSSGPKILEINANPGLQGITQATGINVSEYIVRFAEKLVKQKKWLLQKEDILVAA